MDQICPEVSGCCGAILADKSLQHCIEVSNSTPALHTWGGGLNFLRRGTGECVPTIGWSDSSVFLEKFMPANS